MKKLYIKTYGCQMNVYDSARMADLLTPLGYGFSDTPDDADMVILNTCHIREKAAEKVYSELGRLRETKALRVQTALAWSLPWLAVWHRPKAKRLLRVSLLSISWWARNPITGCPK